MAHKVHQYPGEVEAEDGLVIFDGLSTVMESFTPAVAAQIGHRLIEAARLAEEQQAMAELQVER